jgi:uncharacterized Zn finger protein (UPF0148 family)
MKAEHCSACGYYNEPFAVDGTLNLYCTKCGQNTDLGPAPPKPKPARPDPRAERVPPPKKRRFR